jgi:hypothetical protein
MQVDYSPITDAAWSGLRPVVPFFFFAVVVLFAFKVLEAKFAPKKRGRRRTWQTARGTVVPFRSPQAVADRVPDAADQLRIVMKAEFKPQPLLNKSEARLFKAMDKIVLELRPDWQVMAQVSLGEILRTDDKSAYACVNSKRVDLLIVDVDCKPFHAFEYQGGGHFKGAHATAARDAVKKEALRRAGIGYTEVVPGDTPAELRRLIEKLLQQPAVTT